MSEQQQRPPYPPAPPYPQQAGAPQPPRPAGVPPYPAGMKMPVGMKMPPRPMGYPMPAGVKMPPRPAGMPPMGMPPPGGVGMPPHTFPAAEPMPPVPSDENFEEEWGEEDASQPEVDENGFIDDLEEDVPEPEEEETEAEEENPYEHNMASDLGLPPAFVKTKVLLPLFFLLFVFGGIAGFFGGTLQNKSEGELPGVVNNAEIPKGRPRCGIAQKGQGCVLYIMNAQRREVEGKEFFGMAADILGVPKFQIETANIRYAIVRIPPGYIALLNVPPVQ
ncbi:MAG: hypothetical protein IJ846_05970 [Alphaproteobacteria bacterium]|nr:hypothetical protein [Alphaproteobacteria bacterium]